MNKYSIKASFAYLTGKSAHDFQHQECIFWVRYSKSKVDHFDVIFGVEYIEASLVNDIDFQRF